MFGEKEAKPWQPRTSYVRGDRFIWKDITYFVTEAFITGQFFDTNDSRYQAIKTVSGDTRGISSIAINEDNDLIITYSDGTMQNAGRLPAANADLSVVERLVVNGPNSLSTPNNSIDTSRPAILTINHVSYFSVEVPTLFTLTLNSVVWDAVQAGFDLTDSDSVVLQYTRVAP